MYIRVHLLLARSAQLPDVSAGIGTFLTDIFEVYLHAEAISEPGVAPDRIWIHQSPPELVYTIYSQSK